MKFEVRILILHFASNSSFSMTIADIYETLIKGLQMPFSNFISTDKRIHILYLFSSFLLAYYVYIKSKIDYSFLKYIFKKEIWFSKSAIVDYYFIFFNSFTKILLISPYLIFGLYIAFHIEVKLSYYFGYLPYNLSVTEVLTLYTLTLAIVKDFASYVTHFLMHKVNFLWEFHKIHHSATLLNPITQYRLHPVELLINNIKGILVFGLVTGFFDYLSTNQIHQFTFLGVSILSFMFLFFGANLRHSHVKLKYPSFLEKIFISPFQHQIHHSDNPIHFNKNIGSKLAIWDWLFGTLLKSKSVKKLNFGLGKDQNLYYNSFLKNLYQPFKNIYYSLISNLTAQKR